MQLLPLLTSPKGAINRKQFLFGQIAACLIVGLLSGIILFFVAIFLINKYALNPVELQATLANWRGLAVEGFFNLNTPLLTIFAIIAATQLALLWTNLCLMLKRLSDLAVSRWLVLIYYFFHVLVWFVLFKDFVWGYYISLAGVIICWGLLLFWPTRRDTSQDMPRESWFATVKTLLFSTKGSIQRGDFGDGVCYLILFAWLWLMIWALISKLALVTVNGLDVGSTTSQNYIILAVYVCVLSLMIISVLWVLLCLMLKRITDLKLARWMVLIPFIGIILGCVNVWLGVGAYSAAASWALSLYALITLCYFLALLFWPSRKMA